jgi:hypothetical protein
MSLNIVPLLTSKIDLRPVYLLCLEFNSEEDAMKELAQLEDCFFIIEKVYNI